MNETAPALTETFKSAVRSLILMSGVRRRAPRDKRAQTFIEVTTPLGIQIIDVLFWIGGLSGLVLGVLAINQGFYETFFDMQILLYAQGAAMTALGTAMFVTATGITSGARWSIGTARVASGVAVAWSAVGVVLAVYSVQNLPSVTYSPTLYGIILWLLIFGIGVSILSLSYLFIQGDSVRRYTRYVTAEIVTPENMRTVTTERPVADLRHFCWNCGATLGSNEEVCPKCGARRDFYKEGG